MGRRDWNLNQDGAHPRPLSPRPVFDRQGACGTLEDDHLHAALRRDGLVAPFVLEGPTNSETFMLYVETVLAPSLSEGDIVVIDNLSAHKVAGVCRSYAIFFDSIGDVGWDKS
jgi:hypothetical protein